MTPKSEGLGTIFNNFFNGVKSLLTTGSWKVEELADQARSAETLLDRAEVEIDIDAQKTLDQIDAGLTAFHDLELRAEGVQKNVDFWQHQAEEARNEAKKHSKDSEEYNMFAKLVRDALVEIDRYQSELEPINEALEEARPSYEAALDMVETVGMQREEAKSQRTRLQIAHADAKTREMLAAARRGEGDLKAKGLLDEAETKINEIKASARSGEAIADRMPASAEQTSAKISLIGRDARVDDAFERMMAEDDSTDVA